jgi:hypothetical protein
MLVGRESGRVRDKRLRAGGVLGSLVRSRDVGGGGEEAITTQTRAERVEIVVWSRPI